MHNNTKKFFGILYQHHMHTLETFIMILYSNNKKHRSQYITTKKLLLASMMNTTLQTAMVMLLGFCNSFRISSLICRCQQYTIMCWCHKVFAFERCTFHSVNECAFGTFCCAMMLNIVQYCALTTAHQ